MRMDIERLKRRTAALLQAQADPEKAEEMAAYMKTEMPFYGVAAKPRDKVVAELAREFRPADRDEYQMMVEALWNQPHREEKYVAIRLARRFKKFITLDSLPLYESMIREGAWWDFVDEITQHLVSPVLLKSPTETWPLVEKWLVDDNMWIRRAAMLSQNRHREKTNEARLFKFALTLAEEDEFFIRKAIGWALREYAKVDQDAVRAFLEDNRDTFANLTLREASKHMEWSASI